MRTKEVKIKDVDQNENSRVVYKTSDLSALMRSISKNGLLQPIGVTPLKGKKGKYECVYGNRRLVACAKLGWDNIPAVIVKVKNEVERDILGLTENFKRVNTTVLEDGRMFGSLKDRGMTDKEIAARLDISSVRVELALESVSTLGTELTKKIRHAAPGRSIVRGREITGSGAMNLLRVAKKQKLSNRKTKELVRTAIKSGYTLIQTDEVAKLLTKGFSIARAAQEVKKVKTVDMRFLIPIAAAKRAEKKYKKPILHVLYDVLLARKEFGMSRQFISLTGSERAGLPKYHVKGKRGGATAAQ